LENINFSLSPFRGAFENVKENTKTSQHLTFMYDDQDMGKKNFCECHSLKVLHSVISSFEKKSQLRKFWFEIRVKKSYIYRL